MAFRGEIADFGAFYEATYQGAYRTALGIVRDPVIAADVTQDAYLAAYRQRDRFRGEAPSGAWLHRIVVNQALSALRRRRPASRVVDLSPTVVPDHAPGTAGQVSLLDALGSLSPRHRAAVVLRYYHDHDYATIARILDTTPSNVGVMLTRALDRLRTTLEPDATAVGGGRER